MGLKLMTAPAIEPVSLAEAAAHLRVDVGEEEAYLLALIAASREQAEVFCNRQFITAEWRLTLEDFPCWTLTLPKARLQSIQSIKYIDEDGVQQTLNSSKYQVVTSEEPGRVVPAYGETWPVTRCQPDAVEVNFTAGYGSTADSVPQAIRHGINVMVSTHYENRESIATGTIVVPIPGTARSLLAAHKLPKVV